MSALRPHNGESLAPWAMLEGERARSQESTLRRERLEEEAAEVTREIGLGQDTLARAGAELDRGLEALAALDSRRAELEDEREERREAVQTARARSQAAQLACRDLLMHVQEHEMSIGDLKLIIDENGLKFLAFGVRDTVRAAFRAMFPFDGAETDLDHWATFEAQNPATFASMYPCWLWKPA